MCLHRTIGTSLLSALICGAALDTVWAVNQIEQIVGADPTVSYGERVDLIRALPARLADSEQQALLAFLTNPDDPASSDQAATLRNNVADYLWRNNTAPDAIADALINAWTDERQSARWHDFCLQHLGILFSGLSPVSAEMVEKELWAASDMQNDVTAGTALLALSRNTQHGVDAVRVMEQALHVAGDPAWSEGSRTTALQIAASGGAPRAIEIARRILGESRSVSLRLSALAAVGVLGDSEDLALLEQYSHNPLPLLRRAAQAAEARLNIQ